MSLTRETWPIAAALLQFPAVNADGTRVQDADAAEWRATFDEVAGAGFDHVEINDNWVRPGDLAPERLLELGEVAREAGLAIPSIAVVRSSILDPRSGEENLTYSHRTIEAAAALGAGVVSLGLHQPLTPAQRRALWFWTVPGARDDIDDPASWSRAVDGYRDLGRHAAALGVELSLEMYEDTYLGTGDSAVRLVQDIGLDNVGLNPDIGNLIRAHRPVENWDELLQKTLPYANYWHVKNYARDEDQARGHYSAVPAPLEFGLINYRKAVKDAIAYGFRGVFTCEHYGGDGLSVSATNRRYLRTLLPPEPRSSEETTNESATAIGARA